MKTTKLFEEYIKTGVVKIQSPDKSRSDYLKKESEKDYLFLIDLIKSIKISDDNANNFVKSCYDIIMETIRAKMLLDGFYATGQGAHEAEISYLIKLGFNENDISFADQIRYFRNGMLYYGTIVDKEYAEKIINFTKKIYPILKSKLKTTDKSY